jgi:uncharacterized membrane protein
MDPRPPILSRWDLAAAAGLLALGAQYLGLAGLLPDPVPTHFDALGRANGWTPLAQLPYVLFGIPIFLWLVLLAVGAATTLASRKLGGPPAVSLGPLRGLLALGLCLLLGACIAIPVHGRQWLGYGLGAFFLCLATGLGLFAVNAARSFKGLPAAEHYRWGLFYVNPEDPRLLVEKRFGFGWTLNFARPAAPWILALFLAPAVVALAALLGRRH